MKAIKILLVFLILVVCIKTQAQTTTSYNDLKLYNMEIEGLVNEEQGRYLNKIIAECDGILFAVVNASGFTRIIAEKAINLNDIIFKIQSISNIKITNFAETNFTETEYLSAYYERNGISSDLISTTSPTVIKMKDKIKQEKAIRIANSIWEPLYLKK